jgi:hypothetical protein
MSKTLETTYMLDYSFCDSVLILFYAYWVLLKFVRIPKIDALMIKDVK